MKKLEVEQAEVRQTWQRVVDHRAHERSKLQVTVAGLEQTGRIRRIFGFFPPARSYKPISLSGEDAPTNGTTGESRTGMLS